MIIHGGTALLHSYKVRALSISSALTHAHATTRIPCGPGRRARISPTLRHFTKLIVKKPNDCGVIWRAISV